MRKRKVQKYVCLLLMSFILFSGMCHDFLQADSVFVSARENTSTISRLRDHLGEQDAYKEEPSDGNEVYSVVARGRRGREEVFACAEGLSSSAENLSGKVFLQSGVTDVGALKENHSSTVIIEYVHHQDGAKS